MGIKSPARGSVLLREVFRKRAFLNTPHLRPAPALTKCSTTLFNNSNRSTAASRVCWTPSALAGSVCFRGSRGQSESEQTPLPYGTDRHGMLTKCGQMACLRARGTALNFCLLRWLASLLGCPCLLVLPMLTLFCYGCGKAVDTNRYLSLKVMLNKPAITGHLARCSVTSS